jgi:hypothetical protein
VKSLELRDFNALVDQMVADIERQERETNRAQRGSRSRSGERRIPVMT